MVEYCDTLETERREQQGTQSRPKHWRRPLYSTSCSGAAVSRALTGVVCNSSLVRCQKALRSAGDMAAPCPAQCNTSLCAAPGTVETPCLAERVARGLRVGVPVNHTASNVAGVAYCGVSGVRVQEADCSRRAMSSSRGIRMQSCRKTAGHSPGLTCPGTARHHREGARRSPTRERPASQVDHRRERSTGMHCGVMAGQSHQVCVRIFVHRHWVVCSSLGVWATWVKP
jgi:hypothetical protein